MKRITNTYKGSSAGVLITKNRLLFLLCWLLVFSSVNGNDELPDTGASVEVKVLVKDAFSGELISTAQISAINEEAAGTLQDDGSYLIYLTEATGLINISAFNYGNREIDLKGREIIEVDLYSKVFSNNYGFIEGPSQRVRKTFNPLSANDIDQVDEYSQMLTVDEIINSRLGGEVRSVNRSGSTGMGSSLFIRGYNSLNMNAQPLIIVDGVIWNSFYDAPTVHYGFFGNTLANIELNDVENVSIIKDATSIYGSKGANGVILITTKRGKGHVTEIEFNAYGGITTRPESLPVMDGDQYRVYVSEMLSTTNLSPAYVSQLDFLNTNPSHISYKRYNNATKWEDEVYRQGIAQNYHISVNGGDDIALYALSVGYTGVEGVIKRTNMERLSTRFNADMNLSKLISLGLNLSFATVDRDLLDEGVSFYTSPAFLAMIKSPFLNPYKYSATGEITTDYESYDIFGISNPTALIDHSLNTNKQYRFTIGGTPTVKIIPELEFSSQFDYSLNKVKETSYIPIIGVAPRILSGYGVSTNVFESMQSRNISIFDDSRLRYINSFNNIHDVDIMLGWRYLSDYFETDLGQGHNTGTDQLRNLFSDQEFRFIDGANQRVRSISNYMNLEYAYNKRYFVNASLAMDASSRFGKETKGGFQIFGHSWGLFPSLNVAWLASSEKFMSKIDWIDILKVRAGVGLTGNDDITAFVRDAYLASVSYIDRASGLVIANIPNTSIQWETTRKMTLGFDAILFNDKLSLSASVYDHKTSDLLGLKELSEQAGKGYYWFNGGELKNQGFEISADLKLMNRNKFVWEAGTNIGMYKNEIISLPDGDYTTNIYGAEILTSVGNPAGLFYGYKTKGVFATEDEASNASLKMTDAQANLRYFGAGDIHFHDVDGNGIINDADKQIIGDPNPDLYGSFYTRLGYGNLTLDAIFSFSLGNDVYNMLRANLEAGSDYRNQSTAMLARWRSEGQKTEQPKAYYGDPIGNSRFSDRWIEDGSYLRVKNIKLTYHIPIQSNWLEGFEVWASANNLYTLTNYLGRDPGVSAGNGVLYQGIDSGLIPLTKSFFIGVKMNL